LTVVAKVGAFGKDVLLSLQFGAGYETDAFFIANAIPGFVFGGILGTIGLVFLPTFSGAVAKGEAAAADTYRTAALVYTTLSLAVGVLTLVGAGRIVSLLAADQPQQTRDLAVLLTRIMSVGFAFSGWVGLQNAVLHANKLLVWPQLVPVLNHAFVICGLLLTALLGGPITIVVVAAVLGWVVMAPVVSRSASTYRPTSKGNFEWGSARLLLALSIPVFLSLSLDQVSLLVGTALAATYPEGAVSNLNYAMRLTVLLSSAFSLIVAYVLFPYLTESLNSGRTREARRYILQSLVAVAALSAPLLAVVLSMGESLIAFVFQRGAFSPEDTATAGRAMILLSPVIVLAGFREVLNRLFLAQYKTKALLIFGVFGLVVNVASSIYFSGRLGVEGIALGSSLGALAYVGANAVSTAVTQRHLIHRDLFVWLVTILIATACATVFGVWVSSNGVSTFTRLGFLFDVAAVIGLYIVILGACICTCPRLRGILDR